MHVKYRKKQTLWIFLVILVANSILSQEAFAQVATTLSAPTVIDTALTPGTSFSIDITVANVEEMFAFQFVLIFDPAVLIATSFSSYDPFTSEWPSEIGPDYVSLAYSVQVGEPERLTTADPKPIVKIDFAVAAFGTSLLDLNNTMLTKTTPQGGEAISHRTVDGYFTNLRITSSVDPRTSTGAIGDTFSINITVVEVVEMWGYEFVLGYDPTIVNATGFASYDPFTRLVSSEINYTTGYVAMNYSAEFGDPGLTTVDPKPIARIDFIVDAVGSFPFDIYNSTIIDIYGVEISHALYDGYFTNVHDIAVTDVTASPTSVALGGSVSINVIATNEGDFNETFAVNVYYDQIIVGSEANVTLAVGETKTLTINGITTGVSKGSHIVRAEAILDGDVDQDDNMVSGGTVRIFAGAYGPVMLLYAIAVGVVVFVVVATVIFKLRGRKKG